MEARKAVFISEICSEGRSERSGHHIRKGSLAWGIGNGAIISWCFHKPRWKTNDRDQK